MKIDCDVCGRRFDPHNSPTEVIGDKWICCSDNHTPEELASLLGISEEEVYEALGLEKESK